MRQIMKPWGYEIIWAHTQQYVGKILFVKAGHKLSLQYHQVKDETIFLKEGSVLLELRKPDSISHITMKPGASFHITPGTIHRIKALQDSEILEASTSQLDDVVRLADDYGRIPVA